MPSSRSPSTSSIIRSGTAVFLSATLLSCDGGMDRPPPDPDSAAAATLSTVQELVIASTNVVDVAAGTVLPDRTVTVSGGRISGVWTDVELEGGGFMAPSEIPTAEMLDGAGRYLIPGLWDAHVHFRDGEELVEENRALLPLYVANGVTTVRDAGGDITTHVLAWRDSVEAGTLLAPRILSSGPKLDGPTGGWAGSIRLASPSEVPAALDSLQALDADYVKIYDGSMSAEVYHAIVEETERRDMIVTGHMPLSADFRAAVEAGLDGTEHLYYAFKGSSPIRDSVSAAVAAGDLGFWDAFWVMLERRDLALERETFEDMAAAGTVAVPTLHIGDVLAWVDENDHQGDPELQLIPPAIEETWQGRVRSAQRSSPENRARTRELREVFRSMVLPMHEAGVTLLAGSDAGPSNSYVYPGYSLHSELEALVEAGLSPLEALRSATLHPATFMRRGDELGRVESGYVADLVLLEANPLDAIANARRISAVVLGGGIVLRADLLQAMLNELRRPG